ncbi:helix-turn-helix domain-containing protein [Jatrophihabitans sp. YIM 134969]
MTRAGDRPAADDEPESRLGVRLRRARRAASLTLRQVGEAAGVSESFVSQVERGVANPSVATVSRLAAALDTTVAALFTGAAGPAEVDGADAPAGRGGTVVRAAERRHLTRTAGRDEDTLVTPPDARTMLVITSVLGAGEGSGDEPYAHAAEEECVIVLAGRLLLEVGTTRHDLATGDSVLFDPSVPHAYRNPGPEPATTLWITCPPVY